ncbi:MAG: methyl-accepting chemotaxis protein [Candidatus Parabeggiatoa sp.]|nr:methyl-accepting chemotaxis protein [Candidatus Parabeggiatoa sp.]
MLKNLKIGTKLSIAFLTIILIFIIAGLFFLLKSEQALSQAAFNQLESVRADKQAQIEAFFTERQSDMQVLLDTVALFRQNTFKQLQSVKEIRKRELEHYFQERLHDVTVASKTFSIAQALHQFDEVLHLEEASKADTRRSIEQQFHTELNRFTEKEGYHHFFLIAKEGDVVYSTTEVVQLGINLLNNQALNNTPLNRAFKKGLKGVTIQDFSPGILSEQEHQPVAFFAAPVFKAGELRGVLLLCITPEHINVIMQQPQGLGKTGEAYLVGELNSQSTYRSKRVAKNGGRIEKVDEEISQALAGQSGTKIKMDNTGLFKITTYAPLNIPNLNWGIVVTFGLEESLTLTRQGEKKDFFAQYITEYGYYDAFLIHPKGQIFYTVLHESDYKTNIMTGEYANSGLGQLTQEVLKTKKFGISDFAPYAPSHREPTAFIAQPLIIEGKIEMVIALQISDVELSEIMQQRAGMGKTGEAYLVGSDKLMRSNSFLDPVNHSIKASFANPAKGSIDTESTRAALAGETGSQIIFDYREKPVLSTYTPIKIGNTTWAIIAEIDQAEAFAAMIKLKTWLGLIMLIGLAVIMGIAFLISQSIKRPLTHLVAVSQTIAAGNLDNEIIVTGKDEIAQLLQAFADMQAKLYSVVTSIQEAAQIVDHSAEEIAQSNISLSQRTEQQAASLEETAASMEEMTSTVQQNANNAKMANQLASSAKEQASKGGGVVDTAINAMNEISESSQKVTEIIGVINDIAFQTNLLALNAAVEAARAGEQGRGFAVVASEVRNLAQRSAAAAKEIKGLIRDSVSKVDEGTRLVNDSGKTLGEIVNSVKKVSDIVSEISAASQEQASGINQVNKVVMQMDEMVQQNAAAVEETAAASEALKERAQNLKEQVAFFNMDEEALPSNSNNKPKYKQSQKKGTQATHSIPHSHHNDGWEDF